MIARTGAELDAFDAPTATWFRARFHTPTPVQAAAWPRIAAGAHVLCTALQAASARDHGVPLGLGWDAVAVHVAELRFPGATVSVRCMRDRVGTLESAVAAWLAYADVARWQDLWPRAAVAHGSGGVLATPA